MSCEILVGRAAIVTRVGFFATIGIGVGGAARVAVGTGRVGVGIDEGGNVVGDGANVVAKVGTSTAVGASVGIRVEEAAGVQAEMPNTSAEKTQRNEWLIGDMPRDYRIASTGHLSDIN